MSSSAAVAVRRCPEQALTPLTVAREPRPHSTANPAWQDIESAAERDDQRDRLILASNKMEKSTDKLREAYRTAMETETVGAQVMQDLHEQRQTLERSRGRLSKAGAGLARTSRVLKTMGRRALANKLLLWFMVAFLLLMIIMLLYLELFGNSNASASPPPPMPEMVEDSR